MKDKSRLLVLAALVLLFAALTSGGSLFHGFRLFGPNPIMTMLLIAAAVWLFCGRGKGCCGWGPSDDAEVVVEEDGTGEADRKS